jgi:hypothetical protein
MQTNGDNITILYGIHDVNKKSVIVTANEEYNENAIYFLLSFIL